ncbi:hypothetical protein [Mesorhizobium sp.]|uniref:hypothetical protein n=1 Tax=Mesorhizobium sp. TaxID=1871066 RepID=UPI0025C18C8E|nr:hypothetical protein [Mesorhizobium sp.]
MAFTKHSGIFTPVELELLQKVFDQLCNDRRLALKDGDQREQLASDVLKPSKTASAPKRSCCNRLRSAAPHRRDAIRLDSSVLDCLARRRLSSRIGVDVAICRPGRDAAAGRARLFLPFFNLNPFLAGDRPKG